MNRTDPRDDLLVPSLAGNVGQLQAVYSPTSLALTAFFGGPFAIIAMSALNSGRLQRVASDSIYILVATAVAVGVVYLVHGDGALFGTLHGADVQTLRIVVKAFSLCLFGGAFWMHRHAHRNMRFAGLSPPRALPVALGCIFAGNALLYALTQWVRG